MLAISEAYSSTFWPSWQSSFLLTVLVSKLALFHFSTLCRCALYTAQRRPSGLLVLHGAPLGICICPLYGYNSYLLSP